MRYIYIFSSSDIEAQEIVQDVLFRLWVRRETLLGINSLEKYLQRMAKNLLLDKLKRKAVEQKYITHLAQTGETHTHSEDQILFREYHRIAIEAINQLPPKQKEVFLLRHKEDMTLAEIADYTNSSVMAVQKNLFRAVQYIKTFLREHGDLGAFLLLTLLSENG
jgi:RNA polymerase sigma factor (sigma-70 family)